MAPGRYLWLLATAACARGGDGMPDARPDAPCVEQTYYRDADGDGHGDPASPVQACSPPAGTAANSDDCDDTTAQRHPGLAEICDGLDSDCDPATTETCPVGCTPARRPPPDHEPRIYLVCNLSQAWSTASSICAAAMYKLVQIDDAAENAFVRGTADAAFGAGADLHIGGTDATTEATWVWDGSVPFWQGGSGGVPIDGRYAGWLSGEPNNSNNEDCAEMKPGGGWNDEDCADAQRFICRR